MNLTKINFFVVFMAIYVCSSALGQTNNNDEMCFPIRRSSSTGQQVQLRQGRPGKIGPAGPSGPVGPPGPQGVRGQPGVCECNENEIERLRNSIQELKDRMFNPSTKFFLDYCSIGMKFNNSRIQNNQISASSHFNQNTLPRHGRLDFNTNEGWEPKRARKNEWLQLDLRTPMLVTGVVTQGNPLQSQWVTSYKISCSNTTSRFQYVNHINGTQTTFSGNNDRNSYILNKFPQPITARYFRLVVQSWRSWPSLRMDYITC